MKLRNKKTGEIGDLIISIGGDYYVIAPNKFYEFYDSPTELAKEWEEYEEPKDYWYINEFGTPTKADFMGRETLYDKCRKNFGNYFESEEEAKEAVEKLKAWKRLKGHNLRIERGQRIFVNADNKLTSQKTLFVVDTYEEVEDDLDLLFGGEE